VLTFSEFKASRSKRISGLCPDSDELAQLVNDATRELMRRGNFWGTVRRLRGCIYNGCVAWPRTTGTVLALNRCGHSIPPQNYWYDYNAVLPEDVNNQNLWGDRCWGDVAAVDHGTTPVFNQIPCLNDRYVRWYPSQPTDVGKTITIFGIDTNGQVISGLRSDGTIQDGLVMTLAVPYVQTAFLVRRIDRVIKDPTDGPVRGYQFDGATLYNLASYAASETAPDYRQSKIVSGCCVTTASGEPSQISALVKLAFVPVVNDDDQVLIDNVDALALAMQSIKASDAYDSDNAEKLMLRAIHTLNLDLRDKLPIEQTVSRVAYHGTAHLWKRKIGTLT
jgi:hypothetical protein